MTPTKRVSSTTSRIWQSIRRLYLIGLAGFLAATGSLKADTLRLFTDTTWRSIGPAGNLEGNPITSVGLAWEAANVGWNNSLSYNDSNGAGWHNAIISPLAGTSGIPTNDIWSDGNGYNGSTPSYFRKTFALSGTVTSGIMNLSIDDDAQVYLNGALILDDQNGSAGDYFNINLAPYLVSGQNLLAIKANDSFGLGEGLVADLTIQTVPEPATLALAGLGLLLFVNRRCRE